jgi:hypothetical protein
VEVWAVLMRLTPTYLPEARHDGAADSDIIFFRYIIIQLNHRRVALVSETGEF